MATIGEIWVMPSSAFHQWYVRIKVEQLEAMPDLFKNDLVDEFEINVIAFVYRYNGSAYKKNRYDENWLWHMPNLLSWSRSLEHLSSHVLKLS